MFISQKILIAIGIFIFVAASVAGVVVFTAKNSGQPDNSGGIIGRLGGWIRGANQEMPQLKTDESVSGEQSASELTVNFHQLVTKSNFGNILKLFNPAIDEKNRRMYIVGTKSTNVGVVDLDRDELAETFDIGVAGGFLMFSNNKLYSFDFSVKKCWLIDVVQKKAQDVDFNTCNSMTPQKAAVKWGDYSFTETGFQKLIVGSPGFPTDWRQDLNGAHGVIEIRDSANKKVGEIVHGPDALYFAIDNTTGKLYTTNTGDGSISIFDLNKLESTNYCENNSCWIKDLDVGNSADQVIVNSAGNIYVRNRLGGSVIYKYEVASKTLTTIANEAILSNGAAFRNSNKWTSGGIGMWPTDMALSKDESRLFVLSHYGALIDVIDAASGNVISKIKFYPNYVSLLPRTDSISAMILDKSHNKIFAVWPENGIIGIADGSNAKVIGTIDLTKYGFSKAINGGPGLVNMAVNEKTNKLYVYLYNEKKLLAFNVGTLAKEGEASLTIDKKRIYAMFSNDDEGAIYLNNKVIDAKTLKETGVFSKGYVTAFNNDTDAVYLVDLISVGPGKQTEKIYEFANGKYTKEWALDFNTGVPSTFYFDFKNNSFYVAYFTSGIVKKYSLSGGVTSTGSVTTPANSGGSTSSGGTGSSASCQDLNGDGKVDSTEQQKCTGGTSGEQSGGGTSTGGTPSGLSKCGDGVCEAVEKGKCTADCQ